MFDLREVNQMEREMCGYLEWQLNVPSEEYMAFVSKVQREFGSTRVGEVESHVASPTSPSASSGFSASTFKVTLNTFFLKVILTVVHV